MNKTSILLAVNIVNAIFAIILVMVSFEAYRTFYLRFYKKGFLSILIASLLWLLGHALVLIGARGFLHYLVFTLFIIFLTLGIWQLRKAALMSGLGKK